MRKLFVLVFGVCFLGALLIPAAYFMLSRDLPPLVTREEVLHTLKLFVEGERQRQFAGINAKMVEPFQLLKPEELSQPLRAAVLAVEGCPDYFSFPKELDSQWLPRVVGYGVGGGLGDPGPGRCEMSYADRVAGALGLPGNAHRAVAIYELRNALTKEELLDLELSSRWFAPGVLGIRSASKRLMGKEPRALDVAESAELLLAEGDYQGVLDCKNPTVLRIQRNNLIERMAALNLIKRPEAERAKAEKLRCLGRPG